MTMTVWSLDMIKYHLHLVVDPQQHKICVKKLQQCQKGIRRAKNKQESHPSFLWEMWIGCISFLFNCPISAPRDSCSLSPGSCLSSAHPFPDVSEPGWIPSARAGTGTQEESGTVLCQRWHFQAGTARGEVSRLGTEVIPNRS